MAKRARDIMSGGADCVLTTETLEQAAGKLAKAGVGAMPICGEDDRLAGMLTDRDIVVRAIARGKDAARTLVGELAQGKPVTVGADDGVGDVLETMRDHKLRRLPVIDGHTLIGIVSQADVARHLSTRRTGKLVQAISEPDPGLFRRVGGGLRRVAIVALPIAGAVLVVRRVASAGAGATIEQSTEVCVPVHTAYNQWTQFEEFPYFMEGVEQVQQLDDTRLHWVAQVGGQRREWDATITEQVPDARVAWRSTTGKANGGVVTFQPLDADRTRVTVQMDYQPDGMAESVGSALGLASRRVRSDLERFRELIESRTTETGAWRGEVHDGAAH